MSDERPLRTLRVAPYFEPAYCYGGPVVSVPNACRALLRIGTPVSVYTTTANGAEELPVEPGKVVDRDGLPVTYYPRATPKSYFRSPALARALRETICEFDILHLHGVFCHSNWAAYRAARRAGVPYVVASHGVFDPAVLQQGGLKKRLYIRLLERRVLDGAARLVALTETEKRQIEALGIDTPVVVIPNGLDREQFDQLPPRSAVDSQWPELRGHPYVLFLSRIHPKKGVDLLLQGFAQLHRTHPEWRLVVAGPDEVGWQSDLEELARSLGVSEAALFPGAVTGERKLALLGNAGVFSLTSHSEGLPTAVVEALFCARPVVITEGCYIPQVAKAGAGVVVQPEARAIGEGLLREAQSGEGRRQMGEEGRRLALREFESERIARLTLEHYRDVVREAKALRSTR